MKKDTRRIFSSGEFERISKVLGDTTSGLTGTEIAQVLGQIGVPDVSPGMTKWRQLFSALVEWQNRNGSGNKLLEFIKHALEPARFIGDSQRYFGFLEEINGVLSFHGIEFRDDGKFHKTKKSESLSEAESRASKLRQLVEQRNLHSDLLRFCSAELLADNYFHAVLEAVKSILEKIRNKSGSTKDGQALIDECLLGDQPKILINAYNRESEISEQKGFATLLKGLIGTFRNPVAHEPRIAWPMPETDAYDLFTITSYAHRRLDGTTDRN